MVVVIEARRMAFSRAIVCQRRTIHQQDVHPSVVVVVEGGGASALSFNDIEFFLAAASHSKVNSSGVRDVNEQRWICWGSLRAWLLRGHRRLRHRTFVYRCRVLRSSRLRLSRQNPTAA